MEINWQAEETRTIKKKGTENEDEDEDFKRLKSLDSNEWESMPEATIALKNYSTSICPVLGRILWYRWYSQERHWMPEPTSDGGEISQQLCLNFLYRPSFIFG